ncbi:hypothetical protein SAMN05660649_04914 [Desulfotomaculum arcticum]|uniref:PcfK-like protein n=1 Tax=Desulfotruncus arcticus DSM 17038 TaxID=1121424 RepID=A0A1I2ZFH3_9FIRM|nr:Cas9 inhibitor AcrIIA9 family protein [Desulfotruncus arcticus]SFH36460.1 hypothetical protein SAMN05660649_04914 [Desulfotomaculum arcticum] [Desulfotruncus arcticus DSM 17038]
MFNNAMTKIRSEITQNPNNPYVQVVGEFLIKHLEANPEAAEKIINQDKTIRKSLDEMRKVAEKKKVGNCAVLSDQEGFTVVLKYFDIDEDAALPVPAAAPVVSPPAAAVLSSVDFDVKLDDLL